MARKASRKIVIIAGPNGAGKTTFAREFLPNEAGCPIFVNADLIAAGLAPFDPARVALRAGRLMLEEIHTQVRKGGSFAFETTLSGRHYAQLIPLWRDQGYKVKLIFLSLPTLRRWPSNACACACVWPKVGTTCRRRLFAAVFLAGSEISRISTGNWWTYGRFMTMQARNRSCWTRES